MTYCAAKFDNESVEFLQSLQVSLGLAEPLPADKLHVTIFSDEKKWLHDFVCLGDLPTPWIFHLFLFRFSWDLPTPWISNSKNYLIKSWPNDQNSFTVVLIFDCLELRERNKELVQKYPIPKGRVKFEPHVSLTYNSKKCIQQTIPNYPLLTIVKEFVEPYDADWKP